MLILEIVDPLTFRPEMRGYSHGQSDQTLKAFRNGQYVGHIDYSVYEGEPHVQMISVPEELRRQGIATAMVRRLQAEFPGTEINMGMLTDDGSKLLATIPQTTTINPEYTELKARLDILRAQETEYQKIADAFYANPNEEDRQKLLAISDDWNDMHDEISQIEGKLRDLRQATRLY